MSFWDKFNHLFKADSKNFGKSVVRFSIFFLKNYKILYSFKNSKGNLGLSLLILSKKVISS
ncbi:hypothetical protein CQA49_00605 [Helicobacter sp. MIT 00-7814]|nr:hypothetical protein CQA49_00605 [Helicobacter sp. MIT 00-7814]RDU57749.1 hypothetical protein CQA37_00605 [Helicobacter sp. MIT 99-10781]